MKNNNCILCHSNNKNFVAKQTFEDEYLTLIDPELNKLERAWVQCNDCNLIYHDPQLEEFETDILYKKFRDPSFRDEIADEYFERIISIPSSESENQVKVNWLNNNISDHIRKGGSILDIGSGGGVFLYTFMKRNASWSPHGVEPTPEFANLTQRKLHCPIHSGNYNKEIFDKKFDLITCNQVLEHTIDPLKFLSDINHDLNSGGYLYMEVPDAIDFEELPQKHDRFLAQHLWYFSKLVLESMFKDAGFKVIKIESQKTIRGRNNLISLVIKE
jgi:SAM-dependent methyltransferase